MPTPIAIIGCGGSGREIQDIIQAINEESETWTLVGYLDDNPSSTNLELTMRAGTPLLGSTEYLKAADAATEFAIGIASGAVRRTIDAELTKNRLRVATLVHPLASIGSDMTIGPGTVIWPGVRLTTNISLGRNVHLNQNATVGHDSTLADYVTVNPMAAISGCVKVGREALIGTHSTVLQGISIGESSVVGAAACVVRDVPSNTVVKGVPAR